MKGMAWLIAAGMLLLLAAVRCPGSQVVNTAGIPNAISSWTLDSRSRLEFCIRLRGGATATVESVPQEAEKKEFNVYDTGAMIAVSRAAITAADPNYIDDPFAGMFARSLCPEALQRSMEKPPEQLARIAVRTKFFDNFLFDAVHSKGITQVVLLGAGFDARGLRGKDLRWYDLPTPTAKDLMDDNVMRVYEVDIQEIMDTKTKLLNEAGMTAEYCKSLKLPSIIRVGADISTDEWVSKLKRYGFDTKKPSCWILEGLLYYFDEPDVFTLMKRVMSLASPGSRLGMNTINTPRRIFKWGTPEPEEFMYKIGLTDVEVFELGDDRIAHGWNMEYVASNGTAPRSDKDANRTWYMMGAVPLGPAERKEKLKAKLKNFWQKARPVVHWAVGMAYQAFTQGFQIRIPLPRWLTIT